MTKNLLKRAEFKVSNIVYIQVANTQTHLYICLIKCVLSLKTRFKIKYWCISHISKQNSYPAEIGFYITNSSSDKIICLAEMVSCITNSTTDFHLHQQRLVYWGICLSYSLYREPLYGRWCCGPVVRTLTGAPCWCWPLPSSSPYYWWAPPLPPSPLDSAAPSGTGRYWQDPWVCLVSSATE